MLSRKRFAPQPMDRNECMKPGHETPLRPDKIRPCRPRRDGRVVECGRLEICCTHRVPGVRIPLSPPTFPRIFRLDDGTCTASPVRPCVGALRRGALAEAP